MSNARIRFDGEDGEVWIDPDMIGGWMNFQLGDTRTVLFTHKPERIAVVKQSCQDVAYTVGEAMAEETAK